MSLQSGPLALAVGLGAIFAALFIVVLTMFGTLARTGRERDLAGRIEWYGPQHTRAPVTDDASGTGKVGRAALQMTKQLMRPETQQHLAERLDLAAVARKPAEWVLLGGCLAVVIAAALSLVTGDALIGIAGGALLGWLGMRMALSFLIRRRRAAFREQLPDLLQLVASALQSGFSLLQALDAVVRENAEPAAGEFSRALTEARLGADVEDCLDTVVERMDSADLRWTVMAIRIQRGVGGNLGEILTTVAATMRERGYLRRQVRALSAEGRLSGYILVALPILVGIWLFVMDPKYMRPLYTTDLGIFIMVAGSLLLVIGAVWMRNTIKLDV